VEDERTSLVAEGEKCVLVWRFSLHGQSQKYIYIVNFFSLPLEIKVSRYVGVQDNLFAAVCASVEQDIDAKMKVVVKVVVGLL